MNYYKRHLGDYAKKAGHLSPLEHGVYTLILDSYYDREQGPTLMEATRWARARTEEEKSAVLAVLDEFFTLGPDERYTQNRVEEELATYRAQAEVNRGIALAREQKKRERKDQASSTNRAPSVDEAKQDREPSHKPIAISHKPVEEHSGADAPSGTVIERRQATLDAIEEALPDDNAGKTKAAKQEKPLAPVVPDWMPMEAWAGYLEMRRKQKKVPTPRAVELLVGKLDTMRGQGIDIIAALDASTCNGWTDVYPPKGSNGIVPNRAPTADLKFRPNAADHSSSNAAMAQTMQRWGVLVPEDGEITFD